MFLLVHGGSGHRPKMVLYDKEFGHGHAAFLKNSPGVFTEMLRAHLPRMTLPCDRQRLGNAWCPSDGDEAWLPSLHSRISGKRPEFPHVHIHHGAHSRSHCGAMARISSIASQRARRGWVSPGGGLAGDGSVRSSWEGCPSPDREMRGLLPHSGHISGPHWPLKGSQDGPQLCDTR